MTKQSGFSLIELSVYLVIVGLLAVVAIPMYTSYVANAKKTKAEGELLVFKQAIIQYSFDNGQYPKKLEDLITKPSDSEAAKNWRQLVDPSNLKRSSDGKILDPWNEPYQYRPTKGGKQQFDLASTGDTEASEPVKIDVWKITSK